MKREHRKLVDQAWEKWQNYTFNIFHISIHPEVYTHTHTQRERERINFRRTGGKRHP